MLLESDRGPKDSQGDCEDGVALLIIGSLLGSFKAWWALGRLPYGVLPEAT